MNDGTKHILRINGDNYELISSFNKTALESQGQSIKNMRGNGIIRDNKGVAQGRHVASIPVEEDAYLRIINDPDYMEFINDPSGATKAWHRLLERFPHWKICEGGVR